MPNYNIVINSNNKVSGTNSSNYNYNFDWSNLEEGEYELTFNFNAEGSAVHKVLSVVCPDLGVASSVYTTHSSTTSAYFNNVIGILHPREILYQTDTHYACSTTDNPIVYLKTRPHSNNFTIYLYNTDGDLTDIGVDYILILSFKKI